MRPMSDLDDLAVRAQAAFEEIHRRAFAGDGAANARLKVEVVEAALAADTPTLVLIAPWTLNGLAFPPDEDFPSHLVINKRRHPVFVTDVAGLGRFRSVNLVTDVSALASPAEARTVAGALAEPFRDAVRRSRDDAGVANPSRRAVLRRITAGE